MRPLSIEWDELLVAAAIFVATMLAFALMSSAAGWPNSANGWPLAVGVALVLALLRVVGPVLDYLQRTGAKLETPFIKLDFTGVARVAVATGQPWVLSDDLIRKSPSVPDSGVPELEGSVQNFANQTEIVVDLEDGGAWYTTRFFAVAATAMVIGSPQKIVLIGQRNGIPRQFGGWIKPEDVVVAFSRQDKKFETVREHALQYFADIRTYRGDVTYVANPARPANYGLYVSRYRMRGDAAFISILVDQMLHPAYGATEPLENPQQPPWTNLAELERLLAAWLICDQVKVDQASKEKLDQASKEKVDQASKEQVMQVLGSKHDVIASTRNGEFVGMVDVHRVERGIVRQLVERAPA